jgi:putative thioredoxin
VVDFWAPWCGPCQFLGPVIEDLASKADGKWELVKVNTDENPEISRDYRIQGIPAVKMFFNGEVAAEFTGALPKHQIEKWLEDNIPDERKKEYNEIIKQINGDVAPDLMPLKLFVDANPDFQEGKVELAKKLALTNPDEAAELVHDIKAGNLNFETAEYVRSIEALVNCDFDENPKITEKIGEGKQGIQTGDLDKSLSSLIEAVMIDKEYCNQLPRKSVIAIFNLLGPDHELTRKYRRRFDMALY